MATVLTCTLLSLCSAVVLASYSGKVLLVSMDGFRWDYLNQVSTPNFDDFARNGVRLPYLNNSFVPKTFPNHFTMATGLFEETHGITENRMYDPVFNSKFSMRNKETRWWNGGEPIWVTAKKQGLKTGTYFWPGSEVEIRGFRPDIWFRYSNSPTYHSRVDTVVDWFKNNGVRLATLYFPEPDHTAHVYGPETQEVKNKVKDMDEVLGYLVQKMEDNDLINEVNIIVTSDHGMTEVDVHNKVVDISDYVNMSKIERIPAYGPVMQILPKEGEDDAIVESLSGVDHITVYKKEDMPEHFHYKNNRRIMPIIVIADEGWLITKDKVKQARSTLKGQHGYDNRLMSMKPIFLARGPNFKVHLQSLPIKNVDLYPLMCELLNIHPSPNNGSLDRVSVLIRQTPDVMRTTPVTSASGMITSKIAVIVLVSILIF